MLTSCGNIGLGQAAAPNDAAPPGQVVAQGQLLPLNGKAASGNVIVYKLDSDGTYVIRLVGVTLPKENGMFMVPNTSPTAGITVTVTNTTGTKNYGTGLSGSLSWNSVTVHSTINAIDYAQALLTH